MDRTRNESETMTTDQDKQAAFAELLEEGKFSRKKKIGIGVLGVATALWAITFFVTGRILFGWPFAVIMVVFLRSALAKPKKTLDRKY